MGEQTSGAPPEGRSRVAARHAQLVLVAACLAGGALSLLVLPPGLGSDAWAWLVWGRELLGLALDPTNGPSWKPLPVLFTTPLAVLGEAAPTLWTIAARAGALLALALAYRLGTRLAGRLAGGLAALALLLTPIVDYAASADSEPLAAAFALWALERHLDGRRGQALALLALAGLGRPEAWILLLLYAGFLVVRERRLRPGAVFAILVPPALWLGPPWIATGEALSAGSRANRLTEASLATADVPALAVAASFVSLVALPVIAGALVTAVVAVLAATGRPGPALRKPATYRPALVLAGGVVLWVLLVAGLTSAGFTGNERYLFPAVAAVCVLGGVGAGVIVTSLGRGDHRREIVVTVMVLALAAPFGLARARAAAGYRAEAGERARAIDGLGIAVDRAGGPRGVLARGAPAVTRPGTQGTLAWDLGVPLSAVARSWPPDPRLELTPPSVVFSRAERRFNLMRAEGLLAPGLEPRPLTPRARGWQVYLVTAPRERGG